VGENEGTVVGTALVTTEGTKLGIVVGEAVAGKVGTKVGEKTHSLLPIE
jgi:hypothetical protein